MDGPNSHRIYRKARRVEPARPRRGSKQATTRARDPASQDILAPPWPDPGRIRRTAARRHAVCGCTHAKTLGRSHATKRQRPCWTKSCSRRRAQLSPNSRDQAAHWGLHMVRTRLLTVARHVVAAGTGAAHHGDHPSSARTNRQECNIPDDLGGSYHWDGMAGDVARFVHT